MKIIIFLFCFRRLLLFQLLLLKCVTVKQVQSQSSKNHHPHQKQQPTLESCLNSHRIFTVAFSSQILQDTEGYNTFSDSYVTLFKNSNQNSKLQLKLKINNDLEYRSFRYKCFAERCREFFLVNLRY